MFIVEDQELYEAGKLVEINGHTLYEERSGSRLDGHQLWDTCCLRTKGGLRIPRQYNEKMIRGFCFLAEGIKVVITAGLVLAAVEYMCGFPLVKGMAPLMDAMEVAASIGIVMLGSLPAAEFLRRILAKPFTRLGGRLGMKAESMTGMLIGLVSVLPALSLYKDMDDKGKVACSAFLVSGASLLAAHMGFVLDTTPIENELSAYNNVVSEYYGNLVGGRHGSPEAVDRMIDEMNAKLKENGSEKIVAEIQSQIDAWEASK